MVHVRLSSVASLNVIVLSKKESCVIIYSIHHSKDVQFAKKNLQTSLQALTTDNRRNLLDRTD